MKVFTKRLSIKVLSILLLGVLSLGGLFLHNDVKATAAGTEEIAATDLLTSNANVTLASDGVRVSSASQYEGELKGVFVGDTTLKFNFPETHTDTDGDGKLDAYYGNFTFRVTDAENGENYFEITYYVVNKANNYTAVYVQYGKEVRMNNSNGNAWYNAKQNNKTSFIFAPSFLSNCGFVDTKNDNANYSNRTGVLSLVWTGDTLAVQANSASRADGKMVTVAAFDGTYNSNVANNGFASGSAWGLPKMNFKNGYKLSFSSNFSETGVADNGSDVTIKEIVADGENYDLTAETMTAPSFYTNYIEWQKNNPTEKVNVTSLLDTTANVTQNENGLTISSNDAYTGTFKGVFMGDTTLRFTFPETYTNAYYGDFSFRIADATDPTKYFDINYYVVNASLKYTATYVQYGKEIRMTAHNGASWYNIQQMNVQNYHSAPAFLSTSGTGDNTFDGTRMGILSLVWTDDVLAVEVNSARNADAQKMMTVAKFDGTYDTEKVDNGFTGAIDGFGLPKLNFENGYTISISSSIESSATKDKGTDVCFKEIANVNLSDAKVNASYKYNLTFETAKISGTDIYIPQNEELGDVQLVYALSYGLGGWQTREVVEVSPTIDSSTIGDKTFTITDDTWKNTTLGAISKTYTLHVEKAYTLTFDVQGGTQIEKIVYSQSTKDRVSVSDAERVFWIFDGWYIGNEKWSGDLSDLYEKDVTLTAKWLDGAAPTIWLNGINDKTFETKGTTVTVGKTDVVAGDDAQNDKITVTLALKKPNETEFNIINDAYALKLDTIGSYVIQYTVTDPSGYSATCERTVEVFERNAPVFTVEEGFETQTNPGLDVELATVTAKNQDGESLTVSVSIVKDGVLIESDGTSFVPEVMGEYTITYFTSDKAPYDKLQSIYSYTVVVVEDDVAPEIGDEFTDRTVKPNTVVTIPTITATDNVTENVVVEVSVYYGTQQITLTNNSFKAEQVGTYRVLLVAEDEAGNKTEKTVYVTVELEGNQGGGCNCSSPSAGGGLGLPMGLLMMAGAFVFGKNIMMKKLKRKENI